MDALQVADPVSCDDCNTVVLVEGRLRRGCVSYAGEGVVEPGLLDEKDVYREAIHRVQKCLLFVRKVYRANV